MEGEYSLLDRLLKSEKVTCIRCKKGIDKPFGNNIEKCHYFECDKCGDYAHCDPIIEIK